MMSLRPNHAAAEFEPESADRAIAELVALERAVIEADVRWRLDAEGERVARAAIELFDPIAPASPPSPWSPIAVA